MIRKNLVVLLIISTFTFSIYLLVESTKVADYKQYPSAFQQRGDRLLEERFPKTASDSLFMMEMEQLQFKDEVRNDLESNRINWQGVIASICLIIGSIVAVVGLFIKWADGKRESDIKDLKSLVITHYNTNIEQHNKIYKVLEVVEDITIRKNIYESLRNIARNYMHYQKGSMPEELQILIAAQSERLIEISEQVMNEKFSMEVYELFVVKMDEQMRVACKQVADMFGCDFLILYKQAQKLAADSFKMRLKAIVEDTDFNHKYDRYKRAADMFLDELIQTTIAKYKEFENDNARRTA